MNKCSICKNKAVTTETLHNRLLCSTHLEIYLRKDQQFKPEFKRGSEFV